MNELPNDDVHSFQSDSTSGASAEDVGVAGSLSVAVISTETLATIENAATIDTSSENVEVTAENRASVTSQALPLEDGASGESVGVGASVSINIINHDVTAELQDGSIIDAAQDLIVTATSHQTTTTEAVGGAAGGTAVTPVVAISLVNNDVNAQLGTSPTTTTVAGEVTVRANHQGLTTTTASGDAEGVDTAVGAALSLAIPNEHTAATINRDVTAANSILANW